MKIGFKSYLLPRFFPISCSGESQSCCAGETGHVGDMWVTPLRSGSALGGSPSVLWLQGELCCFQGAVHYVILQEGALAVRGRMCTGRLKLSLRLRNDLYRGGKSIAKWGQHRGIPGGTEWKDRDWLPLGEQLGGSRWGRSQRSERRSLPLQGRAASSLLPGLSSQENNMKKHGMGSLCTTDLGPWGCDDCS